MSNESSDWSLGSHLMNLTPGVSPPPQAQQIPWRLKPPVEGATIGVFDEENDSPNIGGGGSFPYLQRLDTPTEESYIPFATPPSGSAREDQQTYGNSLGVHGAVLEQEPSPISSQVQAPVSNPVQGNNGPSPDQVDRSVSDDLQSPVSDHLVESVVGSMLPSDATNIAAQAIDNNHQRDIFENANNSSTVGPLLNPVNTSSSDIATNSNRFNFIETKSTGSSVINGAIDVPFPSNSTITSFPPEPTILANKYAVLGPVDTATCHGIILRNHDTVHVKAVSPRTARDVCAQQAMLVRDVGVRAPMEAVVSECGKRAWLVFPPHFGDLHSYVRLRRRLREAEAQRLFAQVATTVENCHSSGLVLRDLKLRKFVFTDSNRQHVVLESVEDSVVAGESDLLHDKHGCPAYVAPEILSSSAYSGRHADMWGLGVILYTMLVGRYPFHNADTSALFAKIRSGKFFIPDWVSSRARHLILSLLRRQPQRRLTAHQVLMHPWLNRIPRDHVGKDAHDHIVPSEVSVHSVLCKSRPP